MGGVNVKNTMVERVLAIIAPHPCSGCGKIGTILCEDCKYDIIHEPFWGCILCGKPNPDGICSSHNSPVVRAYTVGTRSDALKIILNKLKFQHVKAAAQPLAQLLDAHLPLFQPEVIVTPVPTVRSHIRQRGYDQTELMTQYFCVLRGIPFTRLLERATSSTQHTVGRKMRQAQARQAFSLKNTEAIKGKTVVLIDDIVTTGATLIAAAQLLKNAGATVWVATLAYQPLD